MIEETDLHWKGAPQGSLAVIRPPDVPCLRFRAGGRWLFPAFRFDPTDQRVLPSYRIIAAARIASWSERRLLNWLMRTHLDFGTTPAAALRVRPDDVLEAHLRQSEPQGHG